MQWLDKIIQLDKELLLFLNGMHNDFFDLFMFFVTRKETWIPFYAILIFYIIKNFRHKSVLVFLFFIVALVASDQISFLVKETVQRLRPLYDPEITDLVHVFGKKSGQFGFFSGHAANSFTTLTFTAYLFKNKLYTRSILLWALLVSYSRIYLGVHFPLDIVGGIMLGYFLGYLFFRLMMFVENHFFIARQPAIQKSGLYIKHVVIIILVLLVIATVLLFTTHILLHYQLVK